MHREQVHDRAPGKQSSTGSLSVQQLGPGKRTLTEGLAVQRREAAAAPGAELAGSGTAASAPAALPVPVSSGHGPALQMLFGVQRAATTAAEGPAQVHAAAARGTATPATRLPYADQIQRAFGRHDISGIHAHTGSDAAASTRAMGAQAYATGDHVVLGETADLHTVAHEAAHVIQQRGGVQLKGGVGEVGDRHERHADQVADAVVQGKSAEALLDPFAGGSGPASTDHAGPGNGGTGIVQGKFIVTPSTFQPELVKILSSSPNRDMYIQIDGKGDFTVRINLGAGISDDRGVLGETSGSTEGVDENYDAKSQDLKKKPNRIGSLDSYIDDIGGAHSGELKVDIFDRYFRVDPDSQQRTEHTLSRWDKLASLIHELDLHVVPGYQRWLLAKESNRFGQGAQPSQEIFQKTGVDPRRGAEGIRQWIRTQIAGLVQQDEHLNRDNLINMVTTCYRYSNTLKPLEGLVVIRSMQEDLYTIPGLSRRDACEIEEIGKQRSQ